jgi:hypothetical protein
MGRFFCTCSAFHANNDVAVFGTFGPCPNQQMVVPSRYQNNNLLGKVLCVNGEPDGNIMTTLAPKDWHRIYQYQIGPLKSDSIKHSMRVYVLWGHQLHRHQTTTAMATNGQRILSPAKADFRNKRSPLSTITLCAKISRQCCLDDFKIRWRISPRMQTNPPETKQRQTRYGCWGSGVLLPATTTISGHSKNTNTVL